MPNDDAEPQPAPLTAAAPSDVFAKRLAEVRRNGRGWTQDRLAERLEHIGYPLSRSVISELERPETGKGRRVSLDDVVAISYALAVAPLHMIAPLDDDAVVRPTPSEPMTASDFRPWFRGDLPRGLGDGPATVEGLYESQRPRGERSSVARPNGLSLRISQLVEFLIEATEGIPRVAIHDPSRLDHDEYTALIGAVLKAEQIVALLATEVGEVAKKIRNQKHVLEQWRLLPPDYESSDATRPALQPREEEQD